MKKILKPVGITLLILPAALAGFVWWKLQPQVQNLPLPTELVAIGSVAGQKLLASADYRVDYPALAEAFESQELVSYCGVATGVIALNALDRDTSQDDFFTPRAEQVRSRWQVTIGGMSLADLNGLLTAHDLQTTMIHGGAITLDNFRSVIKANLSRPQDYLLLNYQRQALGQGRVGHISPIAAYNSASDQVLILDTASYKYPHTWVPLAMLHAAMQEVDSASGRSRGFIEVSKVGINQSGEK